MSEPGAQPMREGAARIDREALVAAAIKSLDGHHLCGGRFGDTAARMVVDALLPLLSLGRAEGGGEPLKAQRPLTPPPLPMGDQPLWKEVIDLFVRHGVNAPPVELRDKLVTSLQWARYGAALDRALAHSSARPLGEGWRPDREQLVYAVQLALGEAQAAGETIDQQADSVADAILALTPSVRSLDGAAGEAEPAQAEDAITALRGAQADWADAIEPAPATLAECLACGGVGQTALGEPCPDCSGTGDAR